MTTAELAEIDANDALWLRIAELPDHVALKLLHTCPPRLLHYGRGPDAHAAEDADRTALGMPLSEKQTHLRAWLADHTEPA